MRLILLSPLLLLAACGSGSTSPGAVSPEEDKMLNDAASSLEANFMAAPDNAAADNSSDQGNTQ